MPPSSSPTLKLPEIMRLEPNEQAQEMQALLGVLLSTKFHHMPKQASWQWASSQLSFLTRCRCFWCRFVKSSVAKNRDRPKPVI